MWHRFDLWRSCYWDGEEEEKEGIKEKRCGGEQGGSHITGTNCSRWRSQMGGGNKKWRKKRNRNMGMVEGGVMTAGENEWEIFWLYIWPLPSGLTSSFFYCFTHKSVISHIQHSGHCNITYWGNRPAVWHCSPVCLLHYHGGFLPSHCLMPPRPLLFFARLLHFPSFFFFFYTVS